MKKLVILFLSILILFSCNSDRSDKADELPHFVFGETINLISLDPRFAPYIPETRLFFGLFEGLVTYDPETLEPIPGVSQRWEISDDGLVYTFHLREDALWSDGTAVTAQQFAETWLNMLNPETGAEDFNDLTIIRGASEYASGSGQKENVAIRALNDRTFQFELTKPAPYFLTQLPFTTFFVLPLHVIEEYGDQWTAPENFVGNGPFIIESHTEGERITLKKSPTYWDRENVKLGKITILFPDDEKQILEMYHGGEVDWIIEPPSGSTAELLSSPDFHLNPSFFTSFYRFNMRNPPLNDVKVRKALALSINRRELVETVLEGRGIPAYNMIPPLRNYEAARGLEENPELARELLAEAGYPEGKGMKELLLTYNDYGDHRIIAQYLSDLWRKELGISVRLQSIGWQDLVDYYDNHQFEIQRGGWIGHYLDPNSFLEQFISGDLYNWPGVNNSRYDRMMQQTVYLKPGAERSALLKEAEELILHEEVPIIPLFFHMNVNYIDTSVWGGWHENVMDWHPWKWIYRKD